MTPQDYNKIKPVLERVNRLQEQYRHRQIQGALHYAKKAGLRPDYNGLGYLMFCLHNWTIGDGEYANNVFARKALDAWNTRFSCPWNSDRIYRLACARFK